MELLLGGNSIHCESKKNKSEILTFQITYTTDANSRILPVWTLLKENTLHWQTPSRGNESNWVDYTSFFKVSSDRNENEFYIDTSMQSLLKYSTISNEKSWFTAAYTSKVSNDSESKVTTELTCQLRPYLN